MWGITSNNQKIEFYLELENANNQIRIYPPMERSREEDESWNQMIEEFVEVVVMPNSVDGVDIHMTDNDLDLDEYFSPDLVKQLRIIAKMPKCGTRYRMEFEFSVAAAVENNARARYSAEVGRHLEEAGWEEDDINHVLQDYENASSYLNEFFKQHPDKMPTAKGKPD